MKKLLTLIVALLAIWLAWKAFRPSTPETTATVTPSVAAPGERKAIPQSEAISGSALNKAFPVSSGDFKVTFTQEKDGFAQADLFQGSAKVATLSVSDTEANPAARDKFKSSTRRIAGYPAAPVGSLGTAVLVGGRYQVQARSLTPGFTEGDRLAWIEKFRLEALAGLVPAHK